MASPIACTTGASRRGCAPRPCRERSRRPAACRPSRAPLGAAHRPTSLPTHRSDCALAQYSADGNELLDALADAAARVDDDPLALAEHGSFDAVYSTLLHFSSVGSTERARAAELVFGGLAGVVKASKRALLAMASDAEIGLLREALKKASAPSGRRRPGSARLAACRRGLGRGGSAHAALAARSRWRPVRPPSTVPGAPRARRWCSCTRT